MDQLRAALEGVDFNPETFVKAALLLLLASLILGFIGRFVFGKRSGLNHSVSSAIGILFLYALTIVCYSAGGKYAQFVAPLPFVTLSGGELMLFHLPGAEFSVVCTHLVNLLILAFLANLLDAWLPKGKRFFSWLFFRSLTVCLALLLQLLVTWLFSTYLPQGVTQYAPAVLLIVLVVMLAVGALRFLVGAALATVNPLVAVLYTFFFASLVGKQLSRAMLTTVLLAGLLYGLNYLGIAAISIASAVLVAYIPFLLLLIALWYLVNQVL